ncbi:Piso0_002235 [Millerozyma farinosa CBS 7064]|uniref:Piso0_002235 protein n=1 Tax=Pichia sorbitophila (strain ATCC MYA-4447 / BCRC 22081 / CBS 7064 / NBRC 10061 / NRRL Y-12695) TaxID=559304 RepID=G8YC26_PICSO|nr:Piso0_002235 [Millerozyma farinosa CBS 7064]
MDSDKPIIPPRPRTGVSRISSDILPSPSEDNDASSEKSSVSKSNASKDLTEQKSDVKEDQSDTNIEPEISPVAADVSMDELVPQEDVAATDPIIPKRPERKKSSDSKASNSSSKDNNLVSCENKNKITGVSSSSGLETSAPVIEDKEVQKSSDDKHDLPKIPQRPSKITSKSRPDMIGKPNFEDKNLKSECSATNLPSNTNDTEFNGFKEDENNELSSPKAKPQEAPEDKKNDEDIAFVDKETKVLAHEVNDTPKDSTPDYREIPSGSEVASVNDEGTTENVQTENDDEKGKPNEVSETSKLPEAGDISKNTSTTSTSNTPSIPQRPRTKTIKSSKELTETENSQPTSKPKAPPKPKNLSSKIAAFQEMLNQGTSVAPASNKSVAVPKKDNAAVQEGSSGRARLSSDRMKFAQSLQGLVGKGIAPESISSGPAENRVTPDEGTETKTEKVTHITKSRGPKKKRLPGSLKNPVVLETKTRFNITTSQLWEVEYKSHIDAEVNLPADNEEDRGKARDEEVRDEEVRDEEVRDEEVRDEEVRDEEVRDEEVREEEAREEEAREEEAREEEAREEEAREEEARVEEARVEEARVEEARVEEAREEEAREEEARDEEARPPEHATGVCVSDEQVCVDSFHSDDSKEPSQPGNKPRSSSGEYDVEAQTEVRGIPDPRADSSLSGEANETSKGKDIFPTNTECNFEHTSNSGAKSGDPEDHTIVSSNTLHKNDSASSLIDNYVNSQ